VTGPQWKAVGKIVGWLLLFPPWGLYLLWKEPLLSRSAKIRLVVYSVGGLIAVTCAFTLLEIHLVQKTLATANVDY